MLAQQVFANGARKGYVSRIEHGKLPNLTVSTTKRLARTLDIHLEDIPISLRWPTDPAKDPIKAAHSSETAKQPRLDTAPYPSSSLHYSARSVELLGRELEFEKLIQFLNSESNLLWIQIAGSAGQGKSRLAFELMLHAKGQGWSGGFVSSDSLLDFAEEWAGWQPDHPYLLIFDYVFGREAEIGPTFRRLARRAGDFDQPVRIVLIERQRWDQGQFAPLAETPLQDGRAEWFLSLSERHDGNDEAIHRSRFEGGVLELTPIDKMHLLSIIQKLSELEGIENSAIEDEHLRTMKELSSSMSPLYAYLIGKYGLNSRDFKGGQVTDLLEKIVDRDRRNRWRGAFGQSAPFVGQDQPSIRIAVLATIVGGLDCREHRDLGPPFPADPVARHQASVIVGGGGEASQYIPPLEPDLLGEWFVLRCFEEGLPIEEIYRLAWKINPSAVSSFQKRIEQDFPDHVITAELIEMNTSNR